MNETRVRQDHAPQNMGPLRHLALNLLQREQTAKRGVKGERLEGGWDDRYLEKLLTI